MQIENSHVAYKCIYRTRDNQAKQPDTNTNKHSIDKIRRTEFGLCDMFYMFFGHGHRLLVHLFGNFSGKGSDGGSYNRVTSPPNICRPE